MNDIIDINVYENTEEVTINVTPEVVQVNVNRVNGGVEYADQTETNAGVISDKSIAPNTLSGWWVYVKTLAQTFSQKITFSLGALFSPQVAPTHERGRIYFDDVNDCISFMDSISGTSVQVGYETLMRARNNTGATIPNGTLVYISGAIGQNPTIALAQANTEPTSEIIGVATHNIANNTVGKVCVFGLVNDINTSAFNDGDFLYLSSSVAGGLTTTPPTSPNYVVSVGVVEHAHVTQGKILVKPQRALSNNNTLGTSQKVSVTENVVKTNLNTKLDKSTTPSSVYATDASGNQEMISKDSLKYVLEFANFDAFPATGETGKIYIALDTNFTYRWSGSAYVQIGGIQGVFLGSITPTDSPTGSGEAFWIATKNGTYTNFGGLVVDLNSFAFISRDASGNFSISQTEIDLIEYLKKDDIIEVTNLYNQSTDIPNFYIQTTNGNLIPIANANYVVSQIYPVTAGQRVYFTNWIRTVSFAVRFVNSSNTPLKPLKSDGTQLAVYSDAFSDYLIAPAGAVGLQFTIKFNTTTAQTNLIVNNNGNLTETIKTDLIPKNLANPLKITFNGDIIQVESKTNNNNTAEISLLRRNTATILTNSNINITDTKINGVSIKPSSDDIAPANLIGGDYIGGNHGWSKARNIFKSSHGKTFADIGSIYVDTIGKQFVIVRIIDNDNIVIIERQIPANGYDLFYDYPTGTLTYVSNGVNTTSISGYTSTNISSLYSFCNLKSLKFYADDLEITTGQSYCKDFKIIENYDMLDINDFVLKITTQRPVGGYTSNPDFRSLTVLPLFNHSIVYQFSKGGKCVVHHSFTALKKLPLNFHGFIQSSPMTGTGKIYIPKSLPITVGAVNWKFSENPTFNAPTAYVNITNGFWENPLSPPDRILNTVGNYGFHCGYITDIGDSINRKDLVNDSMFISTSRKIYPKAVSIPKVMEIGDTYSVSAFRNVVDITSPGIKSNFDYCKVGNNWYIFLDYHATGIDEVTILPEWSGREIEILESKNTTLLTKILTDKIRISSSSSVTNYGYIVVKIK